MPPARKNSAAPPAARHCYDHSGLPRKATLEQMRAAGYFKAAPYQVREAGYFPAGQKNGDLSQEPCAACDPSCGRPAAGRARGDGTPACRLHLS